MSFVQREISVTLSQLDGSSSSGNRYTIELKGYRCEVVVKNPGGSNGMGMLQLMIWGMSESDMSRFSTNMRKTLTIRGDTIAVSVGDTGGSIYQIFEGTILSAYADYGQQPEVPLVISAQSALIQSVKPANPTETSGQFSVKDVLFSLAKDAGYVPSWHGSEIFKRDQYLHGSAVEQIKQLCDIAGVVKRIENGMMVFIPNGTVDPVSVISIGEGTDCDIVGYPTFNLTGITVRMQFNPNVWGLRKVNVNTSLDRAKGEWIAVAITHELSTFKPNGAWFTTAMLTTQALVLAAR